MKNFKLREKFQLAVLAGMAALNVLVRYAPLDVYAERANWNDAQERQDLYLKNESNRACYQTWLSELDGAKNFSLLDKSDLVNDFVNLTVTYTSDDVNYGKDEYYAPAAQTVCTRRGDCEDFAIAKLYALQYLGVPQNRMCALSVASTPKVSQQPGHVVLVVDTSAANNWSGCLVLDNAAGMTNTLRTLDESGYKPAIAFNFDGVQRWNPKTPKAPSP